MPLIFNVNMVLQHNKPIPVWGWVDDAGDCNLYNKENFPASPFRTDDWKLTTKGLKYSISK